MRKILVAKKKKERGIGRLLEREKKSYHSFTRAGEVSGTVGDANLKWVSYSISNLLILRAKGMRKGAQETKVNLHQLFGQ